MLSFAQAKLFWIFVATLGSHLRKLVILQHFVSMYFYVNNKIPTHFLQTAIEV